MDQFHQNCSNAGAPMAATTSTASPPPPPAQRKRRRQQITGNHTQLISLHSKVMINCMQEILHTFYWYNKLN